MNVYFILTLDTTPPNGNLEIPDYIESGVSFQVIVTSDEPLRQEFVHEIYIIDSKNNRYDLDYAIEQQRLVSIATARFYARGTATIYAEIYDEVLNKSEVLFDSIFINDEIAHTPREDLPINIKNVNSKNGFKLFNNTNEVTSISRKNKVVIVDG